MPDKQFAEKKVVVSRAKRIKKAKPIVKQVATTVEEEPQIIKKTNLKPRFLLNENGINILMSSLRTIAEQSRIQQDLNPKEMDDKIDDLITAVDKDFNDLKNLTERAALHEEFLAKSLGIQSKRTDEYNSVFFAKLIEKILEFGKVMDLTAEEILAKIQSKK